MQKPLLVSLFLAMLLSVGCGDDGGAGLDAGPPAVDQCLSEGDSQIILSRREPDGGIPDGGTPPDQVITYFEDCVRNDCIDHVFEDDTEMLASCTNDCIDDTEVSGLTEGCRGCYLEEVVCVINNCAVPCLSGSGPMCEACVVENCVERFDDCVGFDQ